MKYYGVRVGYGKTNKYVAAWNVLANAIDDFKAYYTNLIRNVWEWDKEIVFSIQYECNEKETDTGEIYAFTKDGFKTVRI